MVTEMISLKLEGNFLKEIDKVVQKENYHNRTEFIRNALREKIDKEKYKEAMEEIKKSILGKAKRKTTEEEYEYMRENAYKLI
ncbi:MAG: ribbon-helix-helix domain-containing protein [Candidatus Nanoarchaeia archaeon]|nr:ribbon-helix-helix domain-containing protein [Candidatus Nanoarchaeia archaeon]